ncbi:hypothetical protein AKJ63_01815 [candidate division MSBL1 archaeon SCGC-AAA259D18]|uniref:N-acetyltransferase domain-containing protein n=1 Tax=candidate division MSBL1 archaeon SCGC-AAA259D18 TaxID=1698262 RepID=A0A133UAK2_9EURY|nr:hypothetical protein AKJ63_01815 [candidate division MSBL1 archaeon SCGC-AAA259D18]
MHVRDAKPQDLRPVYEIAQDSFKDPYPLRLIRHIHSTNPEGFLIAEIGGSIVGYLIGVVRWGNVGHILAIAVDKSHRRKGVGTALMINALERLRKHGASQIKLEVRASNEGAQKFYERLGFESQEVVPSYYSDGEAAISVKYKFD